MSRDRFPRLNGEVRTGGYGRFDWNRVDFIVLDEAHEYSNMTGQRYRKLEQVLHDKGHHGLYSRTNSKVFLMLTGKSLEWITRSAPAEPILMLFRIGTPIHCMAYSLLCHLEHQVSSGWRTSSCLFDDSGLNRQVPSTTPSASFIFILAVQRGQIIRYKFQLN